MIVNQVIIVFTISALLTVSVVLLVLVIYYARSLQRLHKVEQENNNLEKQLMEKPTELLEKAHSQSLDIIRQANKQAADILSTSKNFDNESNAVLKEKINSLEKDQAVVFAKASEEMKTAYQNMLSQIQEQDINAIRTMTKEIQSDVLADFQEFRADLEKETINSEKLVKEKVDEEYLSIEKELQEYKKQKYQKIDEDIYKILYHVSEIVFSQAIPFDKHKQLVTEALETAKKEQVFK